VKFRLSYYSIVIISTFPLLFYLFLDFGGFWPNIIEGSMSNPNGRSLFADFKGGFYDPLQCLANNHVYLLSQGCEPFRTSSTGDLWISVAKILGLAYFEFTLLSISFMVFFGFSIILLTYLFAFNDGDLTISRTLFYLYSAGLFISPPILLGVERGQMDFLTFSILVLALFSSLNDKHQFTIALLVLASVIKILFLPILFVYLWYCLYMGKRFYFFLFFSLVVSILNFYVNWSKFISAVGTQGTRINSFGFQNVFYWILDLFFTIRAKYNFGILPSINPLNINIESTEYWSRFSYVFVFFGLLFISAVFFLLIMLGRRSWLDVGYRHFSNNHKVFFLFNVGFFISIFVTMFVSMQFDYKLIMLIPQAFYYFKYMPSNQLEYNCTLLVLVLVPFVLYNSWASPNLLQLLSDVLLYILIGLLGFLNFSRIQLLVKNQLFISH
jgi:hypothetical protein